MFRTTWTRYQTDFERPGRSLTEERNYDCENYYNTDSEWNRCCCPM